MINNDDKKTNTPTNTYEPHTNWLCCTTYKDRSKFQNILQNLEITDVQKKIIESRYLSLLENFQKRVRNHSIIFFIGRFIITVGSLFVPALLSIQNSDKSFTFNGSSFNIQVYWTTFIISLLVTIWNGILTLFKIDKKYYFLNTSLERLRSEGWQYFGLTGRYSGHLTGNMTPTHQNQFVYFTHYIEKIKMKQVEEEYYKTDEKLSHISNANHTTSSSAASSSSSELYPPSPDQPITSMTKYAPDPVKEAVNSLIVSSHKITEPSTNVIIIPEENIHKDNINIENNIKEHIQTDSQKRPIHSLKGLLQRHGELKPNTLSSIVVHGKDVNENK